MAIADAPNHEPLISGGDDPQITPPVTPAAPPSPPAEAPAAPASPESSEHKGSWIDRLFGRGEPKGDAAAAPAETPKEQTWEPPRFESPEHLARYEQSIADRAIYNHTRTQHTQEINRLQAEYDALIDKDDYESEQKAIGIGRQIKALKTGENAGVQRQTEQLADTHFLRGGQAIVAHFLDALPESEREALLRQPIPHGASTDEAIALLGQKALEARDRLTEKRILEHPGFAKFKAFVERDEGFEAESLVSRALPSDQSAEQALVNRLASGEYMESADIARANELMARGIYPDRQPARR